MTPPPSSGRPARARIVGVGVGVVCFRDDEVLLVRRGRPPRQGEWSLPGGRLNWGETLQAGALRELREETGVEARLLGLIDVVDGLFGDPLDRHYVLVDYAAEWLSGEPHAGDDAAEAQFVALDEALAMVSWRETRRILRSAAETYGGGGQGGVSHPPTQASPDP